MKVGDGLLIVDVACPRPYSAETLDREALGGTEATVVRVARGLARARPVWVAQRGRSRPIFDAGVRWVPYEHDSRGAVGVEDVVVVRNHKILRRLRERHPEARLFLWMHCFPGKRLHGLGRAALESDATVVAVSEHHRRVMRGFLAEHDPLAAARVRIISIHNPIEASLRPNDAPVDPDKLVFLSSPHKGLAEVVRTFAAARRRLPSLRLFVANPGYLRWPIELPEGVVTLGELPHAEAMQHTREAFCLFDPQAGFAETFGLVFAEANAVGTPVLAHPVGAAEEVLAQEPAQIVDATSPVAVIERLIEWRTQGRPRVGPDFRFQPEHVLRCWEAAFEAAARRGLGDAEADARGIYP